MTKEKIYKKVFGIEFIGLEINKHIEFVFDTKYDLTMKDNLNKLLVILIVDDGIVYPYSGEEMICNVKDLNVFGSFEDQNVCIHCNGEGYTENGPYCNKPASECCGGCYTQVECDCEFNY